MKWEPIETAPKNYTHVLLYCPGSVVKTGYWNQDSKWVLLGAKNVTKPPTHWMPLPEPPK